DRLGEPLVHLLHLSRSSAQLCQKPFDKFPYFHGTEILIPNQLAGK
ncbi:hypothetical protein NPIL_86451, partial [Nephila pilipes]